MEAPFVATNDLLGMQTVCPPTPSPIFFRKNNRFSSSFEHGLHVALGFQKVRSTGLLAAYARAAGAAIDSFQYLKLDELTGAIRSSD